MGACPGRRRERATIVSKPGHLERAPRTRPRRTPRTRQWLVIIRLRMRTASGEALLRSVIRRRPVIPRIQDRLWSTSSKSPSRSSARRMTSRYEARVVISTSKQQFSVSRKTLWILSCRALREHRRMSLHGKPCQIFKRRAMNSSLTSQGLLKHQQQLSTVT